MGLKIRPPSGWTRLTKSAGSARLTGQRSTLWALWPIFLASPPDAKVRAPGAEDNCAQMKDDFPALSTATLAGTCLHVWARLVGGAPDMGVFMNRGF